MKPLTFHLVLCIIQHMNLVIVYKYIFYSHCRKLCMIAHLPSTFICHAQRDGLSSKYGKCRFMSIGGIEFLPTWAAYKVFNIGGIEGSPT